MPWGWHRPEGKGDLTGRLGEVRSVGEWVQPVNLWLMPLSRGARQCPPGKPVPQAMQQVVSPNRGSYDPQKFVRFPLLRAEAGVSGSHESWICESDMATTLTA